MCCEPTLTVPPGAGWRGDVGGLGIGGVVGACVHILRHDARPVLIVRRRGVCWPKTCTLRKRLN